MATDPAGLGDELTVGRLHRHLAEQLGAEGAACSVTVPPIRAVSAEMGTQLVPRPTTSCGGEGASSSAPSSSTSTAAITCPALLLDLEPQLHRAQVCHQAAEVDAVAVSSSTSQTSKGPTVASRVGHEGRLPARSSSVASTGSSTRDLRPNLTVPCLPADLVRRLPSWTKPPVEP